jgi:predicted GNAT family N-acyltransferase
MRFTVSIAPWTEVGAQARWVRESVFVVEQKVPRDLEWDGVDADCVHALAKDETGVAIGTGRLLPDGHVGRIAVLAAWRDLGVGSAILDLLIGEAQRRGFAQVLLNAQTQAQHFYEKSGFSVAGGEFMEAGIPHVRMLRQLR